MKQTSYQVYTFRHMTAIFKESTKYIGVIIMINCVLWFVFYCTLLCALFGKYIRYRLQVRCAGLTTLPPFCAVVMKCGNLNFLEPSGPLQDCNGTALPFLWAMCVDEHHAKIAFNVMEV